MDSIFTLRSLVLLLLVALPAGAAPYLVSSRVSLSPADMWEYDLFRVDGTMRTRLTFTKGPEGEPDCSLATGQLAFVGAANGRFQVFVASADGSAAHQVSKGVAEAGHPSFDPAGGRLAYPVDTGDGTYHLAVHDLSTGRMDIVTGVPGNAWAPEWTPDGRSLLFVQAGASTRGLPKSSICLLNMRSGRFDRLTEGDAPERDPHVDPTGRYVAYSRWSSPYVAQIRMLDRVTGQSRPVVTAPGINMQASFTAGGKALLFTSNRSGMMNIWRHDLETGEEVPLDPGTHSDQSPRALPFRYQNGASH